MNLRRGSHNATGLRFGIVASKFNKVVASRLLDACLGTLRSCGVKANDIAVIRVPGAFEIPVVAKSLARSGRFDAVICLGAVIRGETPHFDYIAAEAGRGIMQASLDTGVPVVFGVLTTDTVAQAIERADANKDNRGAEAAKTALEMGWVMREVRDSAKTEGIPVVPRATRRRRKAGRRRRGS